MKWLSITMVVFFFVSCNRPQPVSGIMNSYDLTPLEDGNWQLAELKNIDGHSAEEGYFYQGKKAGTWTQYSADGKNIEKITAYINGQAHGPSITLNAQGQLTERAHYANNQLDGIFEQYQYGKLKMRAEYKEGLLHGTVTKYINYSNKVLSEAEYREGKLNGVFRQFDDEGNIIMQYSYKNGEKIEGGTVN